MKQYKTLQDELKKALADEQKKKEFFAELRKLYTNEAIIFNAMSENDLLKLLMCREIMKALTSKKYSLVHDSNFAKSRAKTVHYHIITMHDDAHKRVLHIYVDSAKSVSLTISSDKDTIEKSLIANQLERAYKVILKKDSYIRVAYDDVVNASKFALLVQESTIAQLKEMLEAEQSEAEQSEAQ